MSSILHIKASPREKRSYSGRVAEAFIDAYGTCHPEDRIVTIDLEKDRIPEFGADAVSGKYSIMIGGKQAGPEVLAWKDVKAEIERFKEADKIVMSAPMWNFGIPYRLKQYFDVIVQPGFTFSFSPDTGYSGLVKGKPALVILARGGEYPADSPGAAYDFQRPYLRTILGFIGFENIREILIEPTLQGGPETADRKLAGAIREARRIAEEF